MKEVETKVREQIENVHEMVMSFLPLFYVKKV